MKDLLSIGRDGGAEMDEEELVAGLSACTLNDELTAGAEVGVGTNA